MFWRVRSRWDYLAFPGLLQWLGVPVAAIGYGWAAVGAEELGLFVAGLGIIFFVAMNALSWTVALAAYYGPAAHPHLDRDGWYAVLGIFFGPLVAPHYLWRTGQEE